jgi:hypothetical protein
MFARTVQSGRQTTPDTELYRPDPPVGNSLDMTAGSGRYTSVANRIGMFAPNHKPKPPRRFRRPAAGRTRRSQCGKPRGTTEWKPNEYHIDRGARRSPRHRALIFARCAAVQRQGPSGRSLLFSDDGQQAGRSQCARQQSRRHRRIIPGHIVSNERHRRMQ